MVPASIRAKGTLTNATDATYPPYEFVASDGHTIEGFDPDLVQAIAKVLNIKIHTENVSFASIIPGLVSGKYDMGASSFIDTAARQKQVDFVTTEQGTSTFYVKASSGKSYDGLDSLCGASVAVENATTQQASAQDQAKKCVADGKPKVDVLTFDNQNEANLAVSSGRADLGYADLGTTSYSIKQSNGQFKLTGKPIPDIAQTGIGLPKGNGMDKAVQAAVQKLMDDGTYQQILKKWGIGAEAIPKSQINIAKD